MTTREQKLQKVNDLYDKYPKPHFDSSVDLIKNNIYKRLFRDYYTERLYVRLNNNDIIRVAELRNEELNYILRVFPHE